MTLIVQSHFDTLLRYVLSATLCEAVVMEVMDQNGHSLSADEVIRYVEQCIF